MNKKRSLLASGIAVLSGALTFFMPHSAHALDLFGLNSVGFDVVQYLAFYAGYAISAIGYIVMMLEVFILQFIMDLNFTIVNSLSVQFGFSIVLAFANILFVAAVIIMAVSTIIRYDTYGYKQVLFKVIIAAIGVNFSLILAGTVVNFADQATGFFMSAAVTQPTNSAAGQYSPSEGFVGNLAGAFNPQRMMLAANIDPKNTTAGSITGAANFFRNGASQIGNMFAAVAGVAMTAVMVVLLNIFFGLLILAFMARFIMLSLLLTIMPAVWLAWVFPFGKPLVNWWRDKFVKYTFFAPMAMFFLYLSMKSAAFLNSAHVIGNQGVVNLAKPVAAGDKSILGGLKTTFGDLAQPLITNYLNFLLIAGTLYGGLYFSSKLGIKAAAAGTNAFEAVGNSIKRLPSRVARGGFNVAKSGATAVGDAAKTAAKARAMQTLDRIRMSGKDDKGNSAITQFGGKVYDAMSGNAVTRAVGLDKLGSKIAAFGKPSKEGIDKRVEAASHMKDVPTDVLIKDLQRQTTGSITYDPDHVAAAMKILNDRGDLSSLSDISPGVMQAMKDFRAQNPNLSQTAYNNKQEELKRGDFQGEQQAYEQKLRDLLKSQSDYGTLKDVNLGAGAPRLAGYAPLKFDKIKGRKETETEAVAKAIASVKAADIDKIAHDVSLFKTKGIELSSEERRARRIYAQSLSREQLKKIGDLNIDTAREIRDTLEDIKTLPNTHELFYEANPNLPTPDTENKLEINSARTKVETLLKILDRSVNLVTRTDATTPPIEVSETPRNVRSTTVFPSQ